MLHVEGRETGRSPRHEPQVYCHQYAQAQCPLGRAIETLLKDPPSRHHACHREAKDDRNSIECREVPGVPVLAVLRLRLRMGELEPHVLQDPRPPSAHRAQPRPRCEQVPPATFHCVVGIPFALRLPERARFCAARYRGRTGNPRCVAATHSKSRAPPRRIGKRAKTAPPVSQYVLGRRGQYHATAVRGSTEQCDGLSGTPSVDHQIFPF